MGQDPHEVLGVPVGASEADIKQAYQTLAQIYHPDRYATAAENVRREAELRMQRLNAAYQDLKPRGRTSRRSSTSGANGPARQGGGRKPASAAKMNPKMRVKHVPGSRVVHRRGHVPFGIVREGNAFSDSGKRCSVLDREFTAWVQLPTVPDFLREMHWVVDSWAERRAVRRLLESASGLPNVRLHQVANAQLCHECFDDSGS